MGPRIAWVVLAFAVVAVSLWWTWASESLHSLHQPHEAVANSTQDPSPALAARQGTSPRTEPIAVAEAIEPSRAEASGAGSPGETWKLAGMVVGAHREPCAGFRVLGSPRIDARCDAEGRFEPELDAALDPPGCTRVLHVYDELNERRATFSVRLTPGLVLRLESQKSLRGRVVDPAGRPVPAEFVVVRNSSDPDFQLPVNEDDGSFQAPLSEQGLRPERVELLFTVGPSVFSAVCSSAELQQPWGATVVLDLCEVRLRLHTSDGDPVRFADLWVEGRRPNAEPTSRLLRLRADPEGLVDVPLERDLRDLSIVVRPFQNVVEATGNRPEVSWALGGHAEWSERRERPPCESLWDIPFHRLEAGDRISGRLLLADGSPARGGVVVCRPEDSWPMFARGEEEIAQTDDDGSFSLTWPEGRSAHLRGGSDSLGWSRARPAVGGDRGVELRLEPTQTVSVMLVEPVESTPTFANGALSYRLELEDGRVESGRGDVAGLTLKHVPIGRHRLSAFAWIPPRFGAIEFDVGEGMDPRVEVRLESSRVAVGKVEDSTGVPVHGARIRHLELDWPSSSNDSPFEDRTDINGRFTVHIGNREAAELEISLEGRPPVRVVVQADTPATWTLP
jgi:hypothetical protein